MLLKGSTKTKTAPMMQLNENVKEKKSHNRIRVPTDSSKPQEYGLRVSTFTIFVIIKANEAPIPGR